MRSTSDIVFGVTGQALRHRVRAGRPTSATFEVFRDTQGDDDDPEFSGTATVDSVNTTLSASAGASQLDPTSIALTSAASVVVGQGRRYLLSENGRREWVSLIALNGSTATSAYPLANDYTTAATFASTDLTAAVDATWVADEANLSSPANPEPDYRIRWTITTAGVVTVAYTFFDLVRGSVDHGITMDDLRGRLWSILDRLPIDDRGNQGQVIIDAAWEDVQAELAAVRINDAALRDAAMVDQFLMQRIKLAFAENGAPPQGMTYAEVLDGYQRFYERHIAIAPSIAIAKTSSGATSTATYTPKWRA